MIVGGLPGSAPSPRNLVLGNPFMVRVGNLSYSLYLWHWPILVVAAQVAGKLSVALGVLLVTASFIPAYLSTRFVEKPIQTCWKLRGSAPRAFMIGAMCMIASLLAAVMIFVSLGSSGTSAAASDPDASGAATIPAGGQVPRLDHLSPEVQSALADAGGDNPEIYADGCHLEVAETEPRECSYGDTGGETLLLTGDSHAAQWFPALERLATSRGYRLVSMTKSSCPFADVTVELSNKDRPYSECAEWNAKVRSFIEDERPLAVFTSTLGSYDVAESSDAASLQDGLRRSWEWAAGTGAVVIPLVDTPYMNSRVPDCLATNVRDPEICSTTQQEAYKHPGLEAAAATGLEHVKVLDLNDKICPGEVCEPVIGGVVVYRDQHHLSASYSQTLAGILGERSSVFLNNAQ
ncbi:acyltransferase [Leucobacter insecticola]|uniref:Acyltransferase n=1 Tax=Leucobacter insecticola TaxID=2714934 RepID=A0A6G8FHV4_9MICO|nr:acyltransferase family protein [Leucobacter insecticola]QIM15873.1 acyltransferase [Leucobacter insecticola]